MGTTSALVWKKKKTRLYVKCDSNEISFIVSVITFVKSNTNVLKREHKDTLIVRFAHRVCRT